MLQCWKRRRGDPPVIANSKVSDAAKRTVGPGRKGAKLPIHDVRLIRH